MQVTIYASKIEDSRKALDRIAKKATRYGIPFSYTVGEPYAKEVTWYGPVEYYGAGQYDQKHWKTMCEAIDIDIDCESMIKTGDWTTIARLEHYTNGNIVTRFVDRDDPIPDDWRTMKPYCTHCQTIRSRNETYLVRNNATGDIRQVGSSCLKDYTGIDPRTAVAFAQLFDAMGGDTFCYDNYDEPRERSHMIHSVLYILALAVDDITKRGQYFPSKHIDSTKERVIKAVGNYTYPSDEAYAKANRIIDWLKTDDTLYGIDYDCSVFAKEGYIRDRQIGILCYAPVSYDKTMAKRAEHQKTVQTSHHVGTVGQRSTFTLTMVKSAYFETSYNGWDTVMVYIHTLKDSEGNVFIWKSQNLPGIESTDDRGFWKFDAAQDGDTFTCKATIKAHSEYQGIEQTELTRLKTLTLTHAQHEAPAEDPLKTALDALDMLEA